MTHIPVAVLYEKNISLKNREIHLEVDCPIYKHNDSQPNFAYGTFQT